MQRLQVQTLDAINNVADHLEWIGGLVQFVESEKRLDALWDLYNQIQARLRPQQQPSPELVDFFKSEYNEIRMLRQWLQNALTDRLIGGGRLLDNHFRHFKSKYLTMLFVRYLLRVATNADTLALMGDSVLYEGANNNAILVQQVDEMEKIAVAVLQNHPVGPGGTQRFQTHLFDIEEVYLQAMARVSLTGPLTDSNAPGFAEALVRAWAAGKGRIEAMKKENRTPQEIESFWESIRGDLGEFISPTQTHNPSVFALVRALNQHGTHGQEIIAEWFKKIGEIALAAQTPRYFAFTNRKSGKGIDYYHSKQITSAPGDSTHPNHLWGFFPVGNGSYFGIVSAKKTVNDGALDHFGGLPVGMIPNLMVNKDIYGNHHRQWRIYPLGSDYFAFQNRATGKFLDHYYSRQIAANGETWDHVNRQWRVTIR